MRQKMREKKIKIMIYKTTTVTMYIYTINVATL